MVSYLQVDDAWAFFSSDDFDGSEFQVILEQLFIINCALLQTEMCIMQ